MSGAAIGRPSPGTRALVPNDSMIPAVNGRAGALEKRDLWRDIALTDGISRVCGKLGRVLALILATRLKTGAVATVYERAFYRDDRPGKSPLLCRQSVH